MTLTRDDKMVRKVCVRVSDDLWQNFKAADYLPIAREIYPIALDGIRNQVSSDDKGIEHLRSTNAAQELLKQGATGFSVNLTSPAREWFELGSALTIDDVFVKHNLDRGLEVLTGAIREVFEVCGIYRELDKAYEHLLAFGTACMLVLPNPKGRGFHYINATTLRFGTYALGIGSDGMVNRCSRKFEMTPAQIAERFGMDAVPGDWRDRIARGEGHKDKITIVNLIEPNGEPKYDKVAEACGFEGGWRSVYWAEWGGRGTIGDAERPILSVSYIRVRPIIAPRLEREAGDVWGRGRGFDALPAARALNILRKDLINISGNLAEPALFLDASLQGQSPKLVRGGITYYNGRDGVAPSQPAIPFASGFQVLFEQQSDIRQELADTFFVSRFATINALKTNPGVKTATEVEQLVRENMGLLGPVVTNLEQEFLNPLVLTVVDISLEVAQEENISLAELAPVLSDEKDNRGVSNGLKIRYVGEVHAAMKSSNIASLQSLIGFTGQVIQASADPSAFDAVDVDAIVREYADASGVKPTCLRDPEDIEVIRGQRAQAQQQAQEAQVALQQAQAMKAGAGAVKDVSATPMANDIFGGMQ